MRVTFTFDGDALLRPRYIKLVPPKRRTDAIKPDPIYKPVHEFIEDHKARGYPFNLVTLLHATGVKMLGCPCSSLRWLHRTLLATGGLYLALDIRHPDLAIRQSFGDFTSGFSHQFGVGLSVMSMSQAFDIRWDRLNPQPVRGNKVLDYLAEIPGGGTLQVEAKGVTSLSSAHNARQNIRNKKTDSQQSSQSSSQSTGAIQTAMIGVIVQAVHKERAAVNDIIQTTRKEPSQATMEIIDPDFERNETAFLEKNRRASQYWHYAGVALFAGLYDVAQEFIARAEASVKGTHRDHRLRNLRFNERPALQVAQRNLVGIQWRPSDRAELSDDVWFYQAIDRDTIRSILVDDIFPDAEPYHYHQPSNSDREREYVDSLLPDGSYFGIGIIQRDALRPLSPRDITFGNLQF